MSKYEPTGDKSVSSTCSPHKDYAWNLEVAQNFINKTQHSWPTGMKLSIVGSQWIEKAILMVSWMPPRNAPMGNWANPIFLHQDRFKFGRELERVFNDYVRNVQNFESRFIQ